jgi:hypothetical protein
MDTIAVRGVNPLKPNHSAKWRRAMKTSLILASAALLATGGIATAQSAGGAGAGTGGSAGGMSGSAGAAGTSIGGSTMGSTSGGGMAPGGMSSTSSSTRSGAMSGPRGSGTSPSQSGMGRPNGSVTPPGVPTGLSGSSDAATTAGRPSPTSQAPLATGSDKMQSDVPASPAPPPAVGGSIPK